MIALRVRPNSDILAATGEPGMQQAASDRFWTWRRILLGVGYLLVFLVGLPIILAGDPNGLILMATAAAGILFLHRTWVGVAVWSYVLASGVVALASGDDTGFYGVVAGLGFGALALPRRSRATQLVFIEPQQSPFVEPQPLQDPVPVPAAVAVAAAGPEPVVVAHTEPVAKPEPPTPSTANGHVGPDPMYPGALFISTIGNLGLTIPGRDLTPELLRRPVIGFIWLYLFARETRRAGDRITRTALIDEVAHGVADPRGRLRGYLRDLSHLPGPLGAMVKVDDELIGFDLHGHDTDIEELRVLAARVREAGRSIDPIDIQHAQELLPDLGDGEFLPGFEDMEKRVTQGRGVAGQVVAEVRTQVHTLCADLAVAVANVLLDDGQAADAVTLLDPILARSEDRDDVARTLITALRESGQQSRAAEIRRRFADQDNLR